MPKAGIKLIGKLLGAVLFPLAVKLHENAEDILPRDTLLAIGIIAPYNAYVALEAYYAVEDILFPDKVQDDVVLFESSVARLYYYHIPIRTKKGLHTDTLGVGGVVTALTKLLFYIYNRRKLTHLTARSLKA